MVHGHLGRRAACSSPPLDRVPAPTAGKATPARKFSPHPATLRHTCARSGTAHSPSVSSPFRLGLAVAQQRQDVSFRTLHRECGTPIKQKRFCPTHEREVASDELVKGWEFAKGQYVLVEEADLESVALQRSRSIELLRFVELTEVDPVFFDRAYYLAPAEDDVARRPYVSVCSMRCARLAWRPSGGSCSGVARISVSSVPVTERSCSRRSTSPKMFAPSTRSAMP